MIEIEEVLLIFSIIIALRFVMTFWAFKKLDQRVDDLQSVYIHISHMCEEENKKLEKLQADVGEMLKDINSR